MLLDALMNMDRDAAAPARRGRGAPSSRAWSRAARSAAPTTSTARCGSSTSTTSQAGSWAGPSEQGDVARAASSPTASPHEEFQAPAARAARARRGRDPAPARRRPRASRRWPARCASRCPKTSTSCTRPREEMLALQRAIYPLTRALAARLAQRRRRRHRGHLDFRKTVRGVAVLRRRARGAEVPAPAPVEARDHGRRRHLRLGGELRPLHAAVRLRDGQPVLEGPVVGVHRRHRRGDPLLPGGRRRHRGGAPGEHRGRRRVGRRPLRLRPRVRGLPRAPPDRDHARRRRSSCSATPGTTTTRPRPGCSASCGERARHVYWLNPEPRGYWDTGDSIMAEYGAVLRRGLRVPQPAPARALRRHRRRRLTQTASARRAGSRPGRRCAPTPAAGPAPDGGTRGRRGRRAASTSWPSRRATARSSGPVVPSATRGDAAVPAASAPAAPRVGWAAPADRQHLAVGRASARQSARNSRRICSTSSWCRSVDRLGVAQVGGGLQRVEARVGERADDPHLLDAGPVDLLDLADEQLDAIEVVELAPRTRRPRRLAALEDVDADDVAVDRADPRRDETERTGPVGQPHPHEHVRGRRLGARPLTARSRGTSRRRR